MCINKWNFMTCWNNFDSIRRCVCTIPFCWSLKLIHFKILGIIIIKVERLEKWINTYYFGLRFRLRIFIYNTDVDSIVQKYRTCVHRLSPLCISPFFITLICLLILMTHISSQAHTSLRLSFAITCCVRHINMLEPKFSLWM